MTAYSIIKFIHITLAIVAVGFNASYGIWIGRAGRDPQHLPFALKGVKFLDDRIANPAYLLLLVSGLAMVLVGDLSLRVFWLAAALVLWLILIGLGYALFTPTLRDQIRALEGAGPDSREFGRLSRRSATAGGVLGLIVIVIVFLMVTKPGAGSHLF